MEEYNHLQKQLEENIYAIAAKNREIKALQEEIANSNKPNNIQKIEEENKNLKISIEKDQKEIDSLLEQIFELQTTLSKQDEEIRILTEENKKLKQS